MSQALVGGSGSAWLGLGLSWGLKRESNKHDNGYHRKVLQGWLNDKLLTVQFQRYNGLTLLLDCKIGSFWMLINNACQHDLPTFLPPSFLYLLAPQDQNVSPFILCLSFTDTKIFPFCHPDHFVSPQWWHFKSTHLSNFQVHYASHKGVLKAPGDLWSRIPIRYAHTHPPAPSSLTNRKCQHEQ